MWSKKEAVTLTLLGLGQIHRKPYCFPSQEKLLICIKRGYDLSMSRRTLNRVLNQLEDEGIFDRIRRHRRGPHGQPLFRSSLYKFRGKVFNWLYSLARRFRAFFSFYRVPKWAQYKPKKEISVLNSGPILIDSVLKEVFNGVHHH